MKRAGGMESAVPCGSAPLEVEDYLMLSGIQHFAFCPRQWALIHVEQQWKENDRTYGGQNMHQRADDPYLTEIRGELLISRSLPLVSHCLKIYGIADVVEFHRDSGGVSLKGREGLWMPMPVEYKYGQQKEEDCDRLQLCAQAVCLEEMLGIRLKCGALYYGKTRHRVEVDLDSTLRSRLEQIVEEMWEVLSDGRTPAAVYRKQCRSCSLYDLCLPELGQHKGSAAEYIDRAVEDQEL